MLTEKRIDANGHERTYNKVDLAVKRIRETFDVYKNASSIGGATVLVSFLWW